MLAEIKTEIFEKYEIRKSKKQKTAFIDYVREICEKNGISCSVEQKGISRNIVMGAPVDESEVVLAAHYDTCANMIIPNFITPKNFLIYIVYQLAITAVLLLVSGAVGVVVGRLTTMDMTLPVFLITLYAILFLMMAGPANKHTANDNTSGVITVLNTMLSMSSEQRARVCFVLFDNEELGLLGSSAFSRMHRKTMKNKPLVNFDCVSDGDYLFAKLAARDRKSDFGRKFTGIMEKHAKECGMTPSVSTAGFYPSDQANFRHGVGVASLNRSPLVGLYMNRIHTSRDTVFIDRNIECLTAAMLELIDE